MDNNIDKQVEKVEKEIGAGRHNFHKSVKLHESTVKEESAGVMAQYKYIMFRGNYAFATNARIAVAANLEAISDFDVVEQLLLDGKKISGDVYKRIISHERVTVTEDGFEVMDEPCKVFYEFAKDEGTFPDVERILETFRETEQESVEYITFDVSLIESLRKAMGVSRLRLDMRNNRSAVRVLPDRNGYDVRGIIMPIISEDSATADQAR